MTTKEQKAKWYQKNKEKLREFESTPLFKEFRNQRIRLKKVKELYDRENLIFQRLKREVSTKKEEFNQKTA